MALAGGNIVVEGDSLSDGFAVARSWVKLLFKAQPGPYYQNKSNAGDTVWDQMIPSVPDQVTANYNGLAPWNAAIIWGGSNDYVAAIPGHSTPAEIYASVQQWCQDVRAAHPDWVIVVFNMLWRTNIPDADVAAFNALLAGGILADADVLVDVHSLAESPATKPTWWNADGVHLEQPGQDGVAALAEAELLAYDGGALEGVVDDPAIQSNAVQIVFAGAVSYLSPVTAGNTLACYVWSNSAGAVAVSDDINGDWGAPVVVDADPVGLGVYCWMFAFLNTAAGTPTVSITAPVVGNVSIIEGPPATGVRTTGTDSGHFDGDEISAPLLGTVAGDWCVLGCWGSDGAGYGPQTAGSCGTNPSYMLASHSPSTPALDGTSSGGDITIGSLATTPAPPIFWGAVAAAFITAAPTPTASENQLFFGAGL